MAAEIIVPVIAGGFILYEVLTRKRRDHSALQEYAREEKWELLIIHPREYSRPFCIRSKTANTYITRYRREDGSTHEAYLKVGWFGGVTLLEEKRVPAKLARAMADPTHPMDCRDCGTTLPAGAKRCPYCKAWRGMFKEG